MKRLIASILLIAMLTACFAGCTSAPAAPETAAPTEAPAAATPTEAVGPADNGEDLANAIAYLKNIYKEVTKKTPADFERVGAVRVGTTKFDIAWSANVGEDLIKIVPNGAMVTVDVNEDSKEEVAYVLTATLTDASGKQESLSWEHVLPAALGEDMGPIVDMAYELGDGQTLGTEATLTGVITAIKTPYSPDYKNITVVISVKDREDKPIECYRLAGEGADNLAVGDTITVTGTLKNYKGTIEFDAGCQLKNVIKGEGGAVVTDPGEILAAAYALKPGESLPSVSTLTGVIVAVVTPFNSQYNNVTVNIEVEGYSDMPIQCFRMKGEGADKVGLGDIITVTGLLKNYSGTIEFDAGCILEKVSANSIEVVTDSAKVFADVKALPNNQKLPYMVTLSGTVHSVITKYNKYLNTISVAIWVDEQNVYCMDLTGDGVIDININDEITVTGMMSRLDNEIRFLSGSRLVSKVDHEMPEPSSDPKKIFKDSEKLWDGAQLVYGVTLTGKIVKVNTPYSEKNKNITVTMQVEGYEDKPVQCYRLIGNGVETLNENDVVTVSGALGKSGSSLVLYGGVVQDIPVQTDPPKAPTDPKLIVDEAFQLKDGQTLSYIATLTGKIHKIDTAYSAKYKNITVSIHVGSSSGTKSLMCYRLAGAGAEDLAVGDVITVSGIIKNYKGTIEFDTGCKLLNVVKGGGAEEEEKPVLTDPGTMAGRLEQAGTLANGEYLPYSITVSGVVTGIKDAYSSQYKNISFYFDAEGSSVYCFRVKGEGMDTLAVGDTVQVTGALTAYNGTAQFDKTATVVVLSKAPVTPPADEPETPSVNASSTLEEIAAALANGETVDFDYTVTGKVTAVYDNTDGTKNVPITTSAGQVNCNNLANNGADWEALAVGDTISVTGKLYLNSKGKLTIKGGTLVARTPAPTVEEPAAGPLTVAQANELAAKLGSGVYSKNVYSLTGVITAINDQYGNITIDDGTGSFTTYGIDGWKDLDTKPVVGATIKITGKVGSYGSTPQMKYPAMEVIG